jgi:hypothetical protein
LALPSKKIARKNHKEFDKEKRKQGVFNEKKLAVLGKRKFNLRCAI